MLGTDHFKADMITQRHFDDLAYNGSAEWFKCHSAAAFRAVPALAHGPALPAANIAICFIRSAVAKCGGFVV